MVYPDSGLQRLWMTVPLSTAETGASDVATIPTPRRPCATSKLWVMMPSMGASSSIDSRSARREAFCEALSE